jgi:hypothetical protein
MSTGVQREDRIEMSQRDRDVLKVMQPVLNGERTQAEAAALLGISARQVRRIQRKPERQGDAAVVHGLRGKPSNHQPDARLKREVLAAYRAHYLGFGPTFAAEKLAEVQRLLVCPRRSAAGSSRPACGRARGAARPTAAAARADPASASWCSSTPASMTGSRAAARSWS